MTCLGILVFIVCICLAWLTNENTFILLGILFLTLVALFDAVESFLGLWKPNE